MEQWAHRKNIERFELELQRETDAERRLALEGLLLRERDRLAEMIANSAGTPQR